MKKKPLPAPQRAILAFLSRRPPGVFLTVSRRQPAALALRRRGLVVVYEGEHGDRYATITTEGRAAAGRPLQELPAP